MSKRRRQIYLHILDLLRNRRRMTEEQQEADSSADDAFLRATDTTTAPAGKPAACESPPTPGPGWPAYRGWRWGKQQLRGCWWRWLHLPLSPGYGISEVVLRMLMHTWFLVATLAFGFDLIQIWCVLALRQGTVTLVVFPKYLIFVWQTLHVACVFSSYPSSS